MKILVTWLHKDHRCRSWTNADVSEHSVMALVAFKESVSRISKEQNISFEEAWNKLFDSIRKADKNVCMRNRGTEKSHQ